jgi:hypothetical protein
MAFYQALDPSKTQIRLLEIENEFPPEEQGYNSILSCQSHACSLQDEPRFTALSYTWGSPRTNPNAKNPEAKILINNQEANVTRNLHDALLALHRPCQQTSGSGREPVYFWVDAVCINQEDLEERSDQVNIMNQIYTRAERVWV